ncbi:MAG TPA: Fur family transcriptional regulator [Jiangellales bacterium]|nr:Fur family transcriptional regulator [Jiangellales bacterium]
MERPDWRDDLRARGYRLTPQRELVLEAVQELDHATPDEVLAAVRRKASGVNISTVYRALDLLEELGLVSHTHLGHGAPAYHAAVEADHVHLVCRSCGRVTEVDTSVADSLVAQLNGSHGFATDVRHLTVFGSCRECGDAPRRS